MSKKYYIWVTGETREPEECVTREQAEQAIALLVEGDYAPDEIMIVEGEEKHVKYKAEIKE